MSATAVGVARSVVSIILLIIGVLFLISAAIDFLVGFGILYALFLAIIGVIFIALSNWV
jgi:hypothetical protein